MSKRGSDRSMVADPDQQWSDDSAPNRESTNATHDAVGRRAYELFEARGRERGNDLDDWLQAERELETRHRGSGVQEQ